MILVGELYGNAAVIAEPSNAFERRLLLKD